MRFEASEETDADFIEIARRYVLRPEPDDSDAGEPVDTPAENLRPGPHHVSMLRLLLEY